MSASHLQQRLDEKTREAQRLKAENERLRTLLRLGQSAEAMIAATRTKSNPQAAGQGVVIDAGSLAAEKIAVVRNLFRGRQDVYALRRESARSGKSGYAPAVEGGWSGLGGGPKIYLPLSDAVIAEHLRGRVEIGVYHCSKTTVAGFLACDLDGKTWELDALALFEVCAEHDVPAALERSRSGNGAHLWGVLRKPSRRGHRTIAWRSPAPRGDDAKGKARPRKLRPALSESGFPASEGTREPHRPAVAGSPPLPERASSSIA